MNKKGSILVITGFILIIIAGLLIVNNNYENKKAGTESKEIYQKLSNTNVKEISTLINEEEKVINIDGNDYIATIIIPTLNLELPVMSDWDYNKMKISPCRYYGSIYTNDLVICAHSYDNLFGRIKNLNTNDILILNDMSGNEYLYEVKVIEILSPNDVEEMIDSDFDLTLYTCTKDALNRVTVRLNRV